MAANSPVPKLTPGSIVAPCRTVDTRRRSFSTSRSLAWRAGCMALALALGAPSAVANDKRILAKDDIEFADALKRAGYRDLSDSVLAAIERSSGGTGESALGVAVSRLKGQREDAEKEP